MQRLSDIIGRQTPGFRQLLNGFVDSCSTETAGPVAIWIKACSFRSKGLLSLYERPPSEILILIEASDDHNFTLFCIRCGSRFGRIGSWRCRNAGLNNFGSIGTRHRRRTSWSGNSNLIEDIAGLPGPALIRLYSSRDPKLRWYWSRRALFAVVRHPNCADL